MKGVDILRRQLNAVIFQFEPLIINTAGAFMDVEKAAGHRRGVNTAVTIDGFFETTFATALAPVFPIPQFSLYQAHSL